MALLEIIPVWIIEIPDHLKTQEMCDEAADIEPCSLGYVLDHLKTQEMCNEAVCNNPAVFFLVPDRFKTQEMCNEAIEVDLWSLYDVPDHLKTQKMCDKAVGSDSYSLQFVPDWFVIEQQIKIWHDNDDWHDDDELIEWYDGYKKRKAQKAKIKEELLPIVWHPDRVKDWCMSEDEKGVWK